jgi:hypothetical protein
LRHPTTAHKPTNERWPIVVTNQPRNAGLKIAPAHIGLFPTHPPPPGSHAASPLFCPHALVLPPPHSCPAHLPVARGGQPPQHGAGTIILQQNQNSRFHSPSHGPHTQVYADKRTQCDTQICCFPGGCAESPYTCGGRCSYVVRPLATPAFTLELNQVDGVGATA